MNIFEIAMSWIVLKKVTVCRKIINGIHTLTWMAHCSESSHLLKYSSSDDSFCSTHSFPSWWLMVQEWRWLGSRLNIEPTLLTSVTPTSTKGSPLANRAENSSSVRSWRLYFDAHREPPILGGNGSFGIGRLSGASSDLLSRTPFIAKRVLVSSSFAKNVMGKKKALLWRPPSDWQDRLSPSKSDNDR